MSRGKFIVRGGSPLVRRSRHKVCKECRTPATHAEIQETPTTTVRLDARVEHDTRPDATYWCKNHTGVTT